MTCSGHKQEETASHSSIKNFLIKNLVKFEYFSQWVEIFSKVEGEEKKSAQMVLILEAIS